MEEKLRHAVTRWGLTAPQVICRNAEKWVCSAESPQFGPVILKIDCDTEQLFYEFRMLSRLHECRVYGFDKRMGLLLEERISPGTTLRQEPSLERRLRTFSEVFHRIHREDCIGPSYLDLLDGIVKYCQMYLDGTELERMAKRAFYICADMFGKYPGTLLLHGDLHHDNILLRADGSYTVIDPKGVTGPAILDIPRFLYNEINMASGDTELHIRGCIDILSNALGYPPEDIGRCFYMETVLANLWNLEDGEAVHYDQLILASGFLP